MKPVSSPARHGNSSWQTLFLGGAVVVAVAVVAWMAISSFRSSSTAGTTGAALRLDDIPFDGQAAYDDLKRLCDLGPRPSGSPGMKAQQELLAAHFEKCRGKVEFQRFTARHPVDGSAVPMANLIVRWNPEAKERVLLCTHYDTLPFPLRDPINPRGRFVGANDGTSGVAILMEMGRRFSKSPPRGGVDFVLFDGEEYIFEEGQPFFLGSTQFAREYIQKSPAYRYRWGVLLDMVGDADLQICREQNSVTWEDTRPLVNQIWATAKRLGVQEFSSQIKYEIRDDHVPLHEIAHIPTCDVIDFDYPSWHTQGDTPDKCSPLSLAKVGWVLSEWLEQRQ